MQQRHQNAAARRANRVPNGDGAAVDIDPGRVNSEFFVDGACLRCKRFVELEQIHIGGVPAGALQGLARRGHGAHAHSRRVQTTRAKCGNARQRLKAQRSGLLGTHHHHSSGTIVQTRCVAGGHTACLVKSGAQACQRIGIGLAVEILVHIEQDGVALLLRQAHTHDFVGEPAGVLRRSRFLLATQGQRVLHLASDPVQLGHVLRRNTHVVLVINIPQAVHDHGIDHLPVAHALAVARVVEHMGRKAHVFLPPGHHDLAVAPRYGLRRQHDGLEARAAHRVDGERWGFLGDTGLHRGLARRILAHASGQHLPHDDFPDLVCGQSRARDGFADHDGAQFRGGCFGQRAAKLAHSGAGGRNDDDVLHGWSFVDNFIQARCRPLVCSAREPTAWISPRNFRSLRDQAFCLTYRPGAGSMALNLLPLP